VAYFAVPFRNTPFILGVRVSWVPHPAENDQPVQGCPGGAGASSPTMMLLGAWGRVVVRPVHRRCPWSSYLPSSRLRGEMRGAMTAPTIASALSRTRYFSQPLTDG
jgi:hypothetical protein